MGAPAFMKEFRDFINFPSDGGLFGGSMGKTGNCESCAAKFSLLKRRRTCAQCQLSFCSACLGKAEERVNQCRRCRALSARPPDREALLALRVRDLCAVLRARGISLHGVTEKTELVDLLIQGPQDRNSQSSQLPGCVFPAAAPQQDLFGVTTPQGGASGISAPQGGGAFAMAVPQGGAFGMAVPQEWDMPSAALPSEIPPSRDTPVAPQDELHTMHTQSFEQTETREQESNLSEPASGSGDFASPIDGQLQPGAAFLDQLEKEEDLSHLSVMQLKLILTRNFVDYRGCCERPELEEKVAWLWLQKRKQRQQGDDVAEEELCKICMEGSVDCVILECGHMCTCTQCGKQLSECPICRQYVLRVVHVFRA